jgi:hypothetical protein
MSGINTGIYPLPDIIQETLDNVAVTNSNLSEAAVFLESSNSTFNIITNVVRPVALSTLDELSNLNDANGVFISTSAGNIQTISVPSIPAVATPTIVASLTIPNTGTYLIQYSFVVDTNDTAIGDPTPLTVALVTFLRNGNTLDSGNYNMNFYPNYAIRAKDTFGITISGTFPMYVTTSTTVLAMRVNNAPEDAALGTVAQDITLTACLISPYFPV